MKYNEESIKEVIRYGFAGVSVTLVNLGIYYILIFVGIDYKWANLVALISSKVYGYIVNKLFVFRSHCKCFREVIKEIGRFFVARGITGLIDYFGLILVVEIIRADKIVSKYLIQIIVILFNYLFGKFGVFKSKD